VSTHIENIVLIGYFQKIRDFGADWPCEIAAFLQARKRGGRGGHLRPRSAAEKALWGVFWKNAIQAYFREIDPIL